MCERDRLRLYRIDFQIINVEPELHHHCHSRFPTAVLAIENLLRRQAAFLLFRYSTEKETYEFEKNNRITRLLAPLK